VIAFKSVPPSKQNRIVRRINDAAQAATRDKTATRDKRMQEAVAAAQQTTQQKE
jgi:hypothetical protein